MKPYTGKVLWVDLSSGTFEEERVPDSIYQKFLGGTGLGAYLLTREIPSGADPLGPDNILGFMPGLLSGSGSLFTGRWMAVAKSPLTGTWGDANCGGTLSFAIKQSGYDGILFKGASAKPVYFCMGRDGPELRDAAHLWGKDAIETEDWLMAEHTGKRRPSVAAIGQAGENRSLLAGIVNDRGRLAARSGLGAVMGSKKLKAIVLAGANRVAASDPLKTRLLAWKCSRSILFPVKLLTSQAMALFGGLLGKLPVGVTQPGIVFAGILAKWGTVGTLPVSVGMGDTPFKNWAGTNRDMPRGNDALDPDRVLKTEQRKYHCRACPLGCGAIVKMPGSQEESHKPEYETMSSFTTLLLNEDLELVYEVNELLNRAGMDSISAGSAVAFAMECYEKGWITQAETGGLALTWGNGEAIRELVYQMITRQGFGAVLADGVKRAAEKIHAGASSAAMHAGGQEIACHDPRLDPGMALHASVDPTPGRHTTGSQLYYGMYKLWTRVAGLKPPGLIYSKASRMHPGAEQTRNAVAVSNFTQFYNAAGACYMGMLIGVDRVPIFEWANAATGWDLKPEEYMAIGRRIQTLRQMFNIREGIDPHVLKVSPRLYGNPPQESGPNRGVSFDLDALMQAYWAEMGWDAATGVPTRATLQELDLEGITGYARSTQNDYDYRI